MLQWREDSGNAATNCRKWRRKGFEVPGLMPSYGILRATISYNSMPRLHTSTCQRHTCQYDGLQLRIARTLLSYEDAPCSSSGAMYCATVSGLCNIKQLPSLQPAECRFPASLAPLHPEGGG